MTLNIPLRWHHFFHRQEKTRRFRRNSQWNDLNPVLCLSFFLLFFFYIYMFQILEATGCACYLISMIWMLMRRPSLRYRKCIARRPRRNRGSLSWPITRTVDEVALSALLGISMNRLFRESSPSVKIYLFIVAWYVKKKVLSRVLRRPNEINKVTSILSPENYFARHFSSLCFLLSSFLIFISLRAIFCLQSNCHGSLKKHPHPTVSIAEFPLKKKKKKKQGKSNKQATRSRVINFRWSSRASR